MLTICILMRIVLHKKHHKLIENLVEKARRIKEQLSRLVRIFD